MHEGLEFGDEGLMDQEEEEDIRESDSEQTGSEDDDEAPAPNSYLTLLQSLNARKSDGEPPKKKARTEPASLEKVGQWEQKCDQEFPCCCGGCN